MIYSSFVFIVMLVLLGEKIVVPNIIQCFLSSKSDVKIMFGGLDCIKFNHDVMNQKC